MANDERSTIVLDNGSGSLKAGFAGEDYPQVMFGSCVGKPRRKVQMTREKLKDSYVGWEAQSRRDILSLRYPVEHGIVTNWDDMERIWHYTFDQLEAAPEDNRALLSEAPLNPKGNRERMTQVMFESFGFPSVSVANHAVLTMFAVGRHMAIIVDSGDGVTHVTPLVGAYMIPGACQRLDVGGRDLTQYLAKLLSEKGYSFSTPNEREIVRDMMEKHCYVASDFDEAMTRVAKQPSALRERYRLPDGEDVTLQEEKFRCVEALFNPSLLGIKGKGIHEMAFESLMRCDIDLRSDLLVNFALGGGNTMYPGLAQRMQKEISAHSPPTKRVRVVDIVNERNLLAFTGGSMWASFTSFSPGWITKEDYEESGPAISHRLPAC